MVLIQFSKDIDSARSRSIYVPGEPASHLLQTWFELPMRFQADGVELLAWQGEGYPVPLLNAALVGLDSIEAAGRTGSSEYYVPGNGRLLFRLHDSDITIYSHATRRTATVKYLDLPDEWRAFSTAALRYLLEMFPTLSAHASAADWFGGLPEWRRDPS